MANEPIKTLFANDIHRRIEEVIKVDQTSDDILRDEISEYVVTDAIRSHYVNIFDAYRETPNKPHEGIAIWVSGFFGSGKSSFAKMLGLSIENRAVAGIPAGDRFAQRAGDNKLQVLLKAINEKIPTHAVIFDVSTDRGIRSGNQSLTEIMYGLFLQSLGYAKDLDLSELEIALEEKGQLEGFEAEYGRLFKKEWSFEKGKVAFALSEASRVLHSLDPLTYPMADSWVKAVKNKADIGLDDRLEELPDVELPTDFRYLKSTPVLFGHYWLPGEPTITNTVAACLDFSVARNGYLTAYRWSGERELLSENLVHVPAEV